MAPQTFMKLSDLKGQIESFYQKVQSYRSLLIESRNPYIPEIEENHDKINEQKRILIRDYAKLESYIKKWGKDPKMSDGVHKIWYSSYDNAFSSDILLRVGPSIDAVLDDLDFIIGKLETENQEDVSVPTLPAKQISKEHQRIEEKELPDKTEADETIRQSTDVKELFRKQLKKLFKESGVIIGQAIHVENDLKSHLKREGVLDKDFLNTLRYLIGKGYLKGYSSPEDLDAIKVTTEGYDWMDGIAEPVKRGFTVNINQPEFIGRDKLEQHGDKNKAQTKSIHNIDSKKWFSMDNPVVWIIASLIVVIVIYYFFSK